MPHGHAHVPEELSEGSTPTTRGERILELSAVALLSLTVLATAWSGYQASLWSGEQSQHYAQASAVRIKSQQASTHAGQSRIDDLLYFNGWLDAHQAGNEGLAEVYRRRFRPAFVPAFEAWIAQHPFTNPNAVPGPLYMPQYRLRRSGPVGGPQQRSGRPLPAGDRCQGARRRLHPLDRVLRRRPLLRRHLAAGRLAPAAHRRARLRAAMLLGGLVFVLTLPVA